MTSESTTEVVWPAPRVLGHALPKWRVLAMQVQQWRATFEADTGQVAVVLSFDAMLTSRGRWHWQIDEARCVATGDCEDMGAAIREVEVALRKLGVVGGDA